MINGSIFSISGRSIHVIDARKTIVVTGIGVISPYGIGLSFLRDGMLRGQCCLKPAEEFYPGFHGTVAAVSDLPSLTEVDRYSRTDRLAMAAARDAVADFI